MGLHGLAFDDVHDEDEPLHWHEFAGVTWVISGTGSFADEHGTVTHVQPGAGSRRPQDGCTAPSPAHGPGWSSAPTFPAGMDESDRQGPGRSAGRAVELTRGATTPSRTAGGSLGCGRARRGWPPNTTPVKSVAPAAAMRAMPSSTCCSLPTSDRSPRPCTPSMSSIARYDGSCGVDRERLRDELARRCRVVGHPHRQAAHDRRRRPAGVARGGVDHRRDLLLDRVRPDAPQDRAVGAPAGDLQHLVAERGEHHLSAVRSVGRRAAAGVAPHVADVVDPAVGEQRLQHVEVVEDVPDRLLPHLVQLRLHRRLVRQPDAEHEPAAGGRLRR